MGISPRHHCRVGLLALLAGLFFSRDLFAGKEFRAVAGALAMQDQLVVGLDPSADISQILAAVVPQAVASRVKSGRNTYLLRLPRGIQAAVSKLLAAHPLVEFVEPNRIFHTSVLPPNDPMHAQQWALNTIHALQAWSYFPDHYLTAANSGSNRVSVAVLDTGVDCTHPDFMNAGGTSTDAANGGQLLWSKSLAIEPTGVSSPACPWQDDYGHGTHTAGTIAAATNNGAGVAAVGYPLQIIAIKVFNSSAQASEADVANGIDAAVAAGAQVISMSLDGDGYSQLMQLAIDNAWRHNVLVVSAAGNTGDNRLQYPGDANHGLTVAATDSNNTVASFSSYGDWVKIAGPGVGVLSTLPTYANSMGGTSYGSLSGTSMATPHVAAVGGMLMMANPGLSVAVVAQRLQQTAQALPGNTGWDQYTGYGVVDAGAALNGNFRAGSLGGLIGQVVDSSSVPVTGAQVVAAGQTVTTTDDGLFRIRNISAGTYSIDVTAGGFFEVNLQAAVVAGADTMLTIPMGVTLGEFTGTVTYNGVPVAGAAVEAVSGGLIQGTAVTDASGTYAVYLPSGTYTLTASAAGFVNTTSGSNSLNRGVITVNLSLSALGTLTGTVTDANGTPVANARVDFASNSFSGGTSANASGVYTTYGIPAGTYSLTASASGYSNISVSGAAVVNNTATLVNLQFSAGLALTSGLIGYWPFDEGSGAITHDQSGSGHDVALFNTAWTAGKFNSGLSFDGTDAYGVSSPIPLSNTFSVSGWANAAVIPLGSNARIAETQYNDGLFLGVDVSGTKYKFIVNSGTGSTGSCGSLFGCTEGGTVTTGWHLIAGTYDGTTAILYVDGHPVASEIVTAPANTSHPLYIGQSYGVAGRWDGVLDDIRLYNRPLTGNEVAALFGQSPPPSLALSKTADAATVSAGTAIGYTFTVTNNGPGIATSAALTDTLPSGAGISWSINPANSACAIANGTLSCNFGDLAAGTTAVHLSSPTINSSCASYPNTATLTATNASTVHASATITVQCPSLNITNVADAATAPAGTSIGYTVSVTNSGPGTAVSASLSDTLPAATGLNWSINPVYSGAGTCALNNGVLTCDFGNLATGTVSVHLSSPTTTSSCAVYQNIATLTAANAGAIQASAATTVLCPSLAIVKTHAAPFTQGQPGATYSITVSNTAATVPTSGQVTVTEVVPLGLALVSMAGGGWTCPPGGTTCWRSDPLSGGTSYPPITVMVNVAADAMSQVTNQATVGGGGSPTASVEDPTSILRFSCDVNSDQVTNIVDVQTLINEAMGVIPAVHDLNHDGMVSVADIQKMTNAALGLGCPY